MVVWEVSIKGFDKSKKIVSHTLSNANSVASGIARGMRRPSLATILRDPSTKTKK
jgi:hypothetical protein